MNDDVSGWVGLKPGRVVGGWAANKANFDQPVSVQVAVGEWLSEPLTANEYRDHLRRRNIGTARHGFSVTLPATLDLTAGQEIVVMVDGHPDVQLTTRVPQDYEHSQPRAMDAEQALQIVADGGTPARRALKSVDDLLPFARRLLKSPRLVNLLRDAGRALLRDGDSIGAVRPLGAARALNPDDPETEIQYAIALSRTGRLEEALSIFRSQRDRDHRRARTLSEYAQTLRRALDSADQESVYALRQEMADVVEDRLAMESVGEGVLPASVALTLGRSGMLDLAERTLAHTAAQRPDRHDVQVTRMRLLIDAGRIADGLEAAREILERWPGDETAAHALRAYRHLASWQVEGSQIATLCCDPEPSLASAGQSADPGPYRDGIERLLRNTSADWIALAPHGSLMEDRIAELRLRLRTASGTGCLRMPDGLELWKPTALADLAEAGLLEAETFETDLNRARPFYLRPADLSGRTTALLISRYGGWRYGGGEHFLQAAAEHYASLGYQSLVLGGIDKKPTDLALDSVSELRFDFVEMTPAVLRRRIIEENVGLVHALSGTGFLMAAALGDMNIPFIYGMHYYREVLGADGDETYFDEAGKPLPRQDFGYLLSRASVVYANSTYSRDLIEKAHGVRCPVIFSVPEELAQ